jgi:hypothetical protein
METAIPCLVALEPAPISHLAGRASGTALETATPSCLSIDRSASFCRRTCQGCKKLTQIKLLVDNTSGDKTLSIIQANCVIKSVKNKKITRMTKRLPTSWLCRRCHLENPSAKPSMQLTPQRLWLHPLRFSSRKGPDCHPRTSFYNGMTIQTALLCQPGTFHGREGIETTQQPPYVFVKFWRGEVGAGRHLAVPGWPHDEAGEVF